MKKKGNRLKTIIFRSALGIVVLVIWGRIFWQAAEYFSAGEDDIPVVNIEEQTDFSLNNKALTTKPVMPGYENLPNDPFGFRAKPVRKRIQTNKTAKKDTIPPPPFSLNGVIINGKSKLAVILDSNTGNTIFLRENETYLEYKITAISKNEITLKRKNKKFTLKINP